MRRSVPAVRLGDRLPVGLMAVRLMAVVGSLPVLCVAVFAHDQPVLLLALLLLGDMAWHDYCQLDAWRRRLLPVTPPLEE